MQVLPLLSCQAGGLHVKIESLLCEGFSMMALCRLKAHQHSRSIVRREACDVVPPPDSLGSRILAS